MAKMAKQVYAIFATGGKNGEKIYGEMSKHFPHFRRNGKNAENIEGEKNKWL